MIPKGSREDIVYSMINSFELWKFYKVLRLTKNMRLENPSSDINTSSEDIAKFSKWILKVGDGKIGDTDSGFAEIETLEDSQIYALNDPVVAIVNYIYPSITDQFNNEKYFKDRAILAPTHKFLNLLMRWFWDQYRGMNLST